MIERQLAHMTRKQHRLYFLVVCALDVVIERSASCRYQPCALVCAALGRSLLPPAVLSTRFDTRSTSWSEVVVLLLCWVLAVQPAVACNMPRCRSAPAPMDGFTPYEAERAARMQAIQDKMASLVGVCCSDVLSPDSRNRDSSRCAV